MNLIKCEKNATPLYYKEVHRYDNIKNIKDIVYLIEQIDFVKFSFLDAHVVIDGDHSSYGERLAFDDYKNFYEYLIFSNINDIDLIYLDFVNDDVDFTLRIYPDYSKVEYLYNKKKLEEDKGKSL